MGEGTRLLLIISRDLNSFKHQIIFSFRDVPCRSDFYHHHRSESSKIVPLWKKKQSLQLRTFPETTNHNPHYWIYLTKRSHKVCTSVFLTLHSADSYQFEAKNLVWFIAKCRSAFSINTIDVYSHTEEAESVAMMWICEVPGKQPSTSVILPLFHSLIFFLTKEKEVIPHCNAWKLGWPNLSRNLRIKVVFREVKLVIRWQLVSLLCKKCFD